MCSFSSHVLPSLLALLTSELSADHMRIFEQRASDFRFFLYQDDKPLGLYCVLCVAYCVC
jgi:hypothetical protein